MSRRRALILLAAAGLFWLCRRAYFVGFFNDDAYYLIGAKSLLFGRYAEVHAPSTPPLVNYLPGWPLLLAPILFLTGGNLAAAQAWAIVLMVAGLGCFAFVFEGESGPDVADGALACAVASPLIVSTAATLLADGPMLFCAGLALALLSRLWPRRRAREWLVFGAALGLAALVRPTGGALAGGVAVVLTLDGRRREAVLVVGASLAVFGAWIFRCAVVSGTGWNYWREAVSAARAGGVPVLANAWACGHGLFARSLLRVSSPGGLAEAGAVSIGFALALMGARGLKTPAGRAAALWAVFFLLPHLVWAKTAERYLIPLVPPAAWLMLRGAERLDRRLARAVAAVSIAASLLAGTEVVKASWSPATERNVPPGQAAAWLREHARSGEVLAAEYDARWHLLTGLRAVHIPYDVRVPDDLVGFLGRSGASYVVVEETLFSLRPAGGDYAVPPSSVLRGLLKATGAARLVHRDGAGRVEVWAVEGRVSAFSR